MTATPKTDVGAVNQAVLTALLTRNWPELERLVPRSPVPDPDQGSSSSEDGPDSAD